MNHVWRCTAKLVHKTIISYASTGFCKESVGSGDCLSQFYSHSGGAATARPISTGGKKASLFSLPVPCYFIQLYIHVITL